MNEVRDKVDEVLWRFGYKQVIEEIVSRATKTQLGFLKKSINNKLESEETK